MNNRKIAVVGATGNVGRKMLDILHERSFPADKIIALASRSSKGKKISYGDDILLEAEVLEDYDFTGTAIALFSPGSEVSRIYAPIATSQGAVVIDNTSYFRTDPDIPLVITEVNPEAIANYKTKGIISNPNCSTMQMLVALAPLHHIAKITRIVVATYQSVSGAGKAGMDELYNGTKKIFFGDTAPNTVFKKRIAFNVIPHIDSFMDDGYTKEEWKMSQETAKILDSSIKVSATCVRVPVFVGHSEAVNVEFANPISRFQAIAALSKAAGVVVVEGDDQHKDYATPVEYANTNPVYVSRIREDKTVAHGLSLWIVSDNIRKGAALNAVEIAEILVRDYGL